MRALVSGCSGQDGSYLCELLLEKGYEVHGIIRRHSIAANQDYRLHHLAGRITTHYGDLTDQPSLDRIISAVMPDEVYNLAAQSHVWISFEMPEFTKNTNGAGPYRMLETCRRIVPHAKYYQASSSEMFGLGLDGDGMQRETTLMVPVSPYGLAKLDAYNAVRHFRRAYRMHCSNGILFNHESPRRGENFVTAKVVSDAVRIHRGKLDKLSLGNMDSHRDWGHSKDYVRAMHLILQQPEPGDWVVATGETRTVRDLCEYVFGKLGMDYRDHVVQNPKFLRSEELPYLRGDASRIRALGWEPTYSFESMMDEIIDAWLEKIK